MEALAYGYIITNLLSFISVNAILLFIVKLLGVNYYLLKNDEAQKAIDVLQPISSGYDISNKFPIGVILSRRAIGYSSVEISNGRYGTKTTYSANILTRMNSNEFEKVKRKTNLRLASFYNNSIYNSNISLEPNLSQRKVLDKIINHYEEFGYVRCFLHGETGVGKTTIAALLAREMEGFLYTDFDMCFDISKLRYGHCKHYPYPTIILIDEADTLIDDITNEKSEMSKKRWNQTLDDIKTYFQCILIMTSNRPPSDITDDESIIMSHRIDILDEMI